SSTGQVDLSGRKHWNDRETRNRCLPVWIGIYGWAPPRNARSTTLTCLLYGADGRTLVVALLVTWVPTVSIRFFVCSSWKRLSAWKRVQPTVMMRPTR